MGRLKDADALIHDITKLYCEDCEKRKGIKNGKLKFVYEIGDVPCRACHLDDMKDAIENAPTVDAESIRHGRWINDDIDKWKCSLCQKGNIYAFKWSVDGGYELQDNYCPNCGALMDEEVKE